MQVVPKLSPKGRDLLQVYLTSLYLSCCTPIMLQVIDGEIYQLNQGLCSISDFIFNLKIFLDTENIRLSIK